MEEEKKDKSQNEQPEHGENWVTHLYDKANVSVNTLNMAAIGLIVLIFALIFVFGK